MIPSSHVPRRGVLRQMARGCTTLPYVGAHPGTNMLAVFLVMGALAGASRGGWAGALGGTFLMALFMVPLYLYGAYERAKDSDQWVATRGPEER